MLPKYESGGREQVILRAMSRQNLKLFSMNFIRCGIAGWCLEVVFTALDSLARGNWKMMGQTSLIMFPIYGLGALLSPMGRLVDWWVDGPEENPGVRTTGSKPVARYIRHGLLYMVLIFLMEYLSGRWLMGLGVCPWDYSIWPDNIDGVIRLGFAPLWFGTGLLFEWLSGRP